MWLNEFPPTLPDAAPDAPEMGSDGPEPDVPMTPIPTTDSEVDAIAPNSATDDTEMDDGSLTAQAKSATLGTVNDPTVLRDQGDAPSASVHDR